MIRAAMGRRYRKSRSQARPNLEGFIVVGVLGLGLSVNQGQTTLIISFLLMLLIVIAVFLFILVKEKRKSERLARSGIDEIDNMSGLEFEKYLQALLLRKGYKQVGLTNTYDLGVDITAMKDGESWAIQAKRYNGIVGLDAVRQVVAAATHYKCDRTMVITNSYFTKNARTIADSAGCVLVDRTKLIELILSNDSQDNVTAPQSGT